MKIGFAFLRKLSPANKIRILWVLSYVGCILLFRAARVAGSDFVKERAILGFASLFCYLATIGIWLYMIHEWTWRKLGNKMRGSLLRVGLSWCVKISFWLVTAAYGALCASVLFVLLTMILNDEIQLVQIHKLE